MFAVAEIPSKTIKPVGAQIAPQDEYQSCFDHVSTLSQNPHLFQIF